MKGGALQHQRSLLRPSECRRIHSDQRQRTRCHIPREKRTTCAGVFSWSEGSGRQQGEGADKDDVRGCTSNAARTQETG